MLTYQHFPLAVGLGHFVSAAHLIQAHAPEDEDDETGATAVLPGSLVLVPVSIAGTEGERGQLQVTWCPECHVLRCTPVLVKLHGAAGAWAVSATLLETQGTKTSSSQRLCPAGSQ